MRNARFDLAFIHSHFHKPLPDEVKTFVQQVSKVLPHVWDTKYLAAQLGTQRVTRLVVLRCLSFEMLGISCTMPSVGRPISGIDHTRT